MKYFKMEENGEVICVGMDTGGTEITKEEYEHLLGEIVAKSEMVDRLCAGEITIDEVRTEWRDEVGRRAERRLMFIKEMEDQYVDPQEALDIILGGEVT